MTAGPGTGQLSWLTPDWPAPAGVRVISTRRGGGSSAAPYASLNLGDHVADSAVAVAENRRRLRAAAGVPAEPKWLAQVHGTRVVNLDVPESQLFRDVLAPEADAAFTCTPRRVCAILTADCLPVVFASTAGTVVGAAHAGWRGLAAGVLEATVAAMRVRPDSLMAWLGPAIGPQHFEVGPEVLVELTRADAGAAAGFVANTRGRFMADLAWLARRRLARVGVTRVYGGGECTYAHQDFYFSHRRDGRTGRQATLIWVERPPNPREGPPNR